MLVGGSIITVWLLCQVEEDEDVHYTQQGNTDYYTADSLAKREQLVHDDDIQASLSMFWHVVSGDGNHRIYWQQYQTLMMSITQALVSDFNIEECIAIVEEDWRMDTGQCPPVGSMTERQLCKSLFELVDTCVLSERERVTRCVYMLSS